VNFIQHAARSLDARAGSCRARPARARPARARSGCAGFTLIELVVAMALGAIVVTSTFAIFGMIDRADKLQSRRLDRAQELAIAHLVMSRTFTTLLMSDETVPGDDKLQERIAEDAASAGADRVNVPESTGKEFRFALQPSRSARLPDGGPAQELDVTLRTPPIIGGLREAGDDQTGLTADQIEMLQRQAADGGQAARTAQSRQNATGPSSRLLVGLLDADASDALSTRLLSETSRLSARDDGGGLSDPTPSGKLPARAPGLRGRFELRAPTPPPTNESGIAAPSPEGLELWWMQYPPGSGPDGAIDELDAETGEAEAADGAPAADRDADGGNINERLAQARQADAPVREIRLISGLTGARWQVYRQKKFVSKMRAAFDRELPAYVEFEFTTTDGRDEKWAFEVAWTSGQEPGSLLRSTQAPLAADLLGGGGGAGTESVLLGPEGRPLTGANGQPLTVKRDPDGRPSLDQTDPSVKVTQTPSGERGVTVNGQPANVGPSTPVAGGKGGGSTTGGAPGGGPDNFTREQIMEMVNRRLREMQGGG